MVSLCSTLLLFRCSTTKNPRHTLSGSIDITAPFGFSLGPSDRLLSGRSVQLLVTQRRFAPANVTIPKPSTSRQPHYLQAQTSPVGPYPPSGWSISWRSWGLLDVRSGAGAARRSLKVRLELFHQHWLGHEADDALDHRAILEQDHRRDAGNAELHRRLLVLVDVQLDDLELASLLGSNLLEHGRDHATRTAPLCPEVDQDGCLTPNFGFERGVRDVCELTHCGESSL